MAVDRHMTLRAVSHGGGRQTIAMLALAAQDRIPHRLFLFSNVGDNAENPETLAYHREIAVPFAAKHGIELREVRWTMRDGTPRDLYDDLLAQENSLTIPLRDSGGFGRRKCTARYKIEVVARELKRLGATVDDPAEVAVGFSLDEIERATSTPSKQKWTRRTYPLLDLGLRLSDCVTIIKEAGLPIPPKSSCSMCPFQSQEQWRDQKRNHPELWERNVRLDATMRARHIRLRGDPAGLASPTQPLDVAVVDQQSLGFCDSGSCFT